MLLAVQDFSVSFRRHDGLVRQVEVPALRGLSFGIARGEVLALVGASGAGKSLLAHALFGILPPNAIVGGALSFDDAALDAESLSRHRGRRMGLVPQSPSHLDPLVRCGTQLRWAARRSGRRLDATDVTSVLERFGLGADAARAFPHQLSGGMARRVMLAIATIGEPDLIVADEPTSGLDRANAGGVLETLRRQADDAKGVLLVTHDLVQALPVADRVAILRDGQLVGIEPASAFSGDGNTLQSPYARSLWRAMPENDFAGASHA
jgi:peptide/nickel transport system ATP-binding protein